MRGSRRAFGAVVGLLVAAASLTPAVPAAGATSAAINTSPPEPCTVTFTASPEVLKETQIAAKIWDQHTRALEEYPYRIQVIEGDVSFRKGENRAPGMGPHATYISQEKMDRFWGSEVSDTSVTIGVGGGSVNGFVLSEGIQDDPLRFRAMVAAHEMGHVLGVGHDRRREGQLMSPILLKSMQAGPSKRALRELRQEAEGVALWWCD